MAIQTLTTFTDPFYSMSVVLEGRSYVFEFRYNQREDRWYFDVSLGDGTLVAAGIKVVVGVDLLRRFADIRLPQGTLLAVANGADASPPGLEELGEGRRVTLTYSSSDEV